MSSNRLKSHGLEGSMSRHGNCHGKAVGESFYLWLICEQVKDIQNAVRSPQRYF